MSISFIKKLRLVISAFFMMLIIFLFTINVYAENLNIGISYGIQNVAKNGKEFPMRISVENRDSQDFVGYMTLSVHENNNSTFVYHIDLNIEARSIEMYKRNISLANSSNTITINIFNKKEELVTNERTNIDLSPYNDRLIIGLITSDASNLSYMDNILLPNTSIQTKTVELADEDIKSDAEILDLIDILVISDINPSLLSKETNDAITSYIYSDKVTLIGLGGMYGMRVLPGFMSRYLINNDVYSNRRVVFNFRDSTVIESYDDGTDIEKLSLEEGTIICLPHSLNLQNQNDSETWFINLINKCFNKSEIAKLARKVNSALTNDYYNINNILNIIDRDKLPDIFMITALLVFYVLFLTIIIYVFLRNTNKREMYGRYALSFSILFTIIMFIFGYSTMKKNTFLTYLSIVNIRDMNAKEKAFMNFRTSDSGNYEFDTSKDVKLNPILRNNREPIFSIDFLDSKKVKTTTFIENDDRKVVRVENANDFDANVFSYENANYLNDIYNVSCSFRRFNGEVTGRITNNMSITIRDAKVLLFGKALDVGDIEPNHSISLSRTKSIGVPVANNSMTADILARDVNKNIVQYYLDENVFGYYDYGLLIGFIDNNGTIDINSGDVGDVYGRTLIVTKMNSENDEDSIDICALSHEVNNVEGYYDYVTNTIGGDVDVVNEYSFDSQYKLTNLYFEGIDNYEHGDLTSNVPFYGDIQVFNYTSGRYDSLNTLNVNVENISDYVTLDNRVIVRFSPTSRDPLYRRVSLPILRATAEKIK